jgi:hypothetical protein
LGQTVTIDGASSTDPENQSLTYSWVQTAGEIVDLSGVSDVSPFFSAPDVGIEGDELVFQLTVTDPGGLSSTSDCTITVNWVNAPPVANAGADQSVNEDNPFVLDGSGSSDEDNGINSYQWSQLQGPPASFSSMLVSQPLVTPPDVNPSGADLVFLLTVMDQSGEISTDTCNVHINYVNIPPAAIDGEINIDEDSTSSISLLGIDADDNALDYSIETLPAHGELAGNAPNFMYVPNPNYYGTDTLTFSVNDGFVDSNTATFTINISSINDEPFANAGPEQSIPFDSIARLSAVNSIDIDDGIADYSWQQIGGPDAGITGSSEEEIFFHAPAGTDPDGEALEFKLTVTDISGAESSDFCIINFVDSNLPPLARVGQPMIVLPDTNVSLSGVNSSDPEGGELLFDWLQYMGPTVAMSGQDTPTPSFQSPSVSSSGETLKFHLTLTDNYGLKSQAVSLVNVSDLYQPPDVDSGTDKVVNAGEIVVLDGARVLESNGSIIEYNWKQTKGTPPVILSDPSFMSPDFIAPALTIEMDLVFRLNVRDSQNLESHDEVSVKVLPIFGGDIDLDRDVDGTDLEKIIQHFNRIDCKNDCNGDYEPDGDVDKFDLEVLAVKFGLMEDSDNDGILDDGDNSNLAGDSPCTGGETTDCDDNCPLAWNPYSAQIN